MQAGRRTAEALSHAALCEMLGPIIKLLAY
jgi:hypothetical protein